MTSEEDVAPSDCDCVERQAGRGQFPQLADGNDLGPLLFVLTLREAFSLVRHQGRACRDAGWVIALADLTDSDLEAILGPEPTPELAAQVAEEYDRLLDRLGGETLRAWAQGKMEGWTQREIAVRLGCVDQTVERKLRSIRRLWSAEVSP
jgi:DNA-directed RNA polymerase specialized sigma24 family protein